MSYDKVTEKDHLLDEIGKQIENLITIGVDEYKIKKMKESYDETVTKWQKYKQDKEKRHQGCQSSLNSIQTDITVENYKEECDKKIKLDE
jgi:hypothetical protein